MGRVNLEARVDGRPECGEPREELGALTEGIPFACEREGSGDTVADQDQGIAIPLVERTAS